MADHDLKVYHTLVKGRVQGVGFRATVKHHANKLGIKGSVKNLHDGQVEIYAETSEAILHKFVKVLLGDLGPVRVEHLCFEEYPKVKDFEGFKIIF